MERKELLQWAIKGLTTEIQELDKTVRKGKGYLTDYYMGKQPKTKLTPEEIKKVVEEKEKLIEELDKKRFDLSWERDVDR